jgi:hypothetical protein
VIRIDKHLVDISYSFSFKQDNNWLESFLLDHLVHLKRQIKVSVIAAPLKMNIETQCVNFGTFVGFMTALKRLSMGINMRAGPACV